MSINTCRAVLGAAVFSVLAAGAGVSATLSEADVPGGFSGTWTSPTVVASDVTSITGNNASGRFDVFMFSGLNTDVAGMEFTFTVPTDGGYRNGGGNFYYSHTPFLGSYGTYGGVFGVAYDPWNVAYANGTSTSTFTFGPGFAGTLYLALDFTYGSVSYGFDVPVVKAIIDPPIAPSAVPLPAAAPLLMLGLGGLGLVALRRRRMAAKLV